MSVWPGSIDLIKAFPAKTVKVNVSCSVICLKYIIIATQSNLWYAIFIIINWTRNNNWPLLNWSHDTLILNTPHNDNKKYWSKGKNEYNKYFISRQYITSCDQWKWWESGIYWRPIYLLYFIHETLNVHVVLRLLLCTL